MAISFKGLCFRPPKQLRPTHVQVQDGEQIELRLPLAKYGAHGGQPPWQSLSWQGEEGPATD
ncbi:hypothetical protein FPV16_08045 [Methylobacterium sp. W2]|uniref:hypothetical protein n=1 Tax=Methylobacterium sp. W2 TaxID=2598107 RepID=UPI001D0C985C|nr:hypothetical protein [Methylobacterium sp. W2]MCC0806162.1 hypothetical protein [Methylobacterium sp. W2]